eukprot:1225515-Karenia_brevis.AAC.1
MLHEPDATRAGLHVTKAGRTFQTSEVGPVGSAIITTSTRVEIGPLLKRVGSAVAECKRPPWPNGCV